MRSEETMKSRGVLGKEVHPSLNSPPPSLLFFALPFTLHHFPLSECLEQAMWEQKERPMPPPRVKSCSQLDESSPKYQAFLG